MAFVFTSKMREACNDEAHKTADLRLARKIRAFRPAPVAAVSDLQLAKIVQLSRKAARGLGIKEDMLVLRFVMVDALISPKFYEQPDLHAHFQDASGTPDIKIGDIFQVIKLTMRNYGRNDEVWW